jgi:hypothetical protein
MHQAGEVHTDKTPKRTLAIILGARFNRCNGRSDYIALREAVAVYGVDRFKKEMEEAGVFRDGHIASEDKPFNPFARIIAGKMENPCKEHLREEDEKEFILFQNLPKNDEHWNDGSIQWMGTASMSKNHKFIAPRRTEWNLFNVATLGMGTGGVCREECVKMLQRMRDAGLAYAEKKGWTDVFLGFHCFPFCTVNTLHMHVVDLSNVGPTYRYLNYKNLSISDVLDVLTQEYPSK